jgi:hypothetical protein
MALRTFGLPTDLIVDCKPPLEAFIWITSDLRLPTIDVDAVLGSVCDALKIEEVLDQKLHDVAHSMAYGDALVESLHDDLSYPYEFAPQIYNAVKRLGQGIYESLKTQGAYLDGYFPYTFGAIVNGHYALHFRKTTRCS